MSPAFELRAFRGVVIAIAIAIALLVGGIAGFGGLEGMAILFGAPLPERFDLGLRNHLRAICVVFAGFGVLVVWSTFALEQRRAAFRIAVATIVLAGLARIIGWLVDGPGGLTAGTFVTMELVLFPLLLAWHTRLIRLARQRSAL